MTVDPNSNQLHLEIFLSSTTSSLELSHSTGLPPTEKWNALIEHWKSHRVLSRQRKRLETRNQKVSATI